MTVKQENFYSVQFDFPVSANVTVTTKEKNGLTQVVINTTDASEFKKLLEDIRDSFKPENQSVDDLVQKMSTASGGGVRITRLKQVS